MKTASGWNMHSVIEAVPVNDEGLRLTEALDIVEKHSLEWIGQSADLETLKHISLIPKAKISHLREIGDRVKFVTIPFIYLDPRSYEDESEDMQRAILSFADIVSPMFHPYVLCPLEHYSLTRHIEAREDLPVTVPQELLPVFQMLDLCLPIFRGIREDIGELRRKLEMNIRAQQERERIHMRDPMMFAVPKTAELDGDGLALIGPAWGPDLEEILLRGFGLTPKPDQRVRIEGSIRGLLEKRGPVAMLEAPTNGARIPIDMILFNQVASSASMEIRERAVRFLEGDHVAALSSGDLSLAARVARLCINYLAVSQRD